MSRTLLTLHVDLGQAWKGGQNQAFLLACGLRDRGHRADVLSIAGSPLSRRSEAVGLEVHDVEPTAVRLGAALQLRGLLRRQCYDVVHCHDANAVTAAWLAGVHRRTATVASRRLAYRLSNGVLGLARYRRARRVVAISEYVKNSVVASGIPAGQVEVVYDGVLVPPPMIEAKAEARRVWRADAGARLVGCVGYLLPEKGQETLIRAFPLIRRKHPDCRLLLAGDGPCRPRLERLSAQLGVGGAVHFAGHVDDVARVYRALDVFLFPSLAEPLGSSLLAAMAYSLPCVAVAAGAVPEIIMHGSNGLLTAEPDPAQMASAATCLLDDPDLAARLGKAARHRIEERFTADQMVEATLDVYQRL